MQLLKPFITSSRLFLPLCALGVGILACTPQALQQKIQVSAQKPSSPLIEPGFGIKSLQSQPEALPRTLFIAASDDQPIRVTTSRVYPKNLSVDLQDLLLRSADLPFEIQKGLSAEEIKRMRKALLKQGNEFLRTMFHLLRDEIRSRYLIQKHALLKENTQISGKNSKSVRKDLQAEIKALEEQYKKQEKALKFAYQEDLKQWEIRITTVLPKPEKGFRTQALGALLSNDFASVAQAMNQELQTLVAESGGSTEQLLADLQAKVQPLQDSIIWLSEQENPDRNVYNDRAVYQLSTSSGQTGALQAPYSAQTDQGVARQVVNSTVLVQETLTYLRSINLKGYSSSFDLSRFLGNLKINFPPSVQAILNRCATSLESNSDPGLNPCVSVLDVDITPTISEDFGFPIGNVEVPQAFTDLDLRQELNQANKFLFTLRLKISAGAGQQTLLDWLKSGIDRVFIPTPDKINAIRELEYAFRAYNLQNAELVLSLESPEMCQKPSDTSQYQQVHTEVSLGDMLKFKDTSNTGEKSGVLAINQDNLLVQGPYRLILKIKPPTGTSIPEQFCTKISPSGECVLTEKDVQFLNYTQADGTPVTGLIDPYSLPPEKRPVAGLRIDPVKMEPAQLRKQISYYIQRMGSNLSSLVVKPAELPQDVCLPIWDVQCVDHNQSLLELNHQALDTGVYALIAGYNNPLQIKELETKTERRFAALHIQYSTFSFLTEKPYILDAWGQPKTDINQTVFSLNGLESFGSYFDADLHVTDPGPQSLPGSVPQPLTSAPGPAIVKETLVSAQSSNFYQGFFNLGSRNTLVNLASGHAEGVNEPYDAFGETRIQSCNAQTKRYLQIGFIADLSNRYTANNNQLAKTAAYQPVDLEVLEASSNQVRARFRRFIKLGTKSYVSVYWDGSPENLSAEEMAALPAEAQLENEGRPLYPAGDYLLRLSLPDDEEQALLQGVLTTALNPKRSDGTAVYPPTDLTWPTLSSFSTQARVNVTGGKSCSKVELNFEQQIIWEYIEKANQDFGDVSSKLAKINLNNAYAALVSPYYQGDFKLAQYNNTPPLVPENDVNFVKRKIEYLRILDQAIEDEIAQLRLFNDRGEINSPAAHDLRYDLLNKLISSKETLKEILSKQWVLEELEFDLSREDLKNQWLLWAIIGRPVKSGTDLIPVHEVMLESIHLLDYVVYDKLFERIKRSPENFKCKFLNTGASASEKQAVQGYLTRLYDIVFERIKLLNFIQEDIFDNDPTNLNEVGPLLKITQQAFAEVYWASNFMNEVCDKCITDQRRQEIIKQPILQNNPDPLAHPYNQVKFILSSPSRKVTLDQVKCRVCDTDNGSSLDTSTLIDFEWTLGIREALSQGDNEAVFIPEPGRPTPPPNSGKGKEKIGISNGDLEKKSMGFSWIKKGGINDQLVVGFSGLNTLGEIERFYNPSDFKGYKQFVEERIAKKLGLNADKVILAETACDMGADIGTYNSIKPQGCSLSNITSEDDYTTVQNDAEIKILETVVRHPKTKDLSNLVLDLFSDRETCQYCQEVIFRANHVEKIVRELGQIVGGIKEGQTNIRQVRAQGFPLFSGEKINQKDVVKPARIFVQDLRSSDRSKQVQMCQPYK